MSNKPWIKSPAGKKRSWTDCGYLTISKNGNVLSIVIENKRYIVNLKDVNDVFNGKLSYALIRKRIAE